MTRPCGAVQIWHDIPPAGVRLTCILPTGHPGDPAADHIEPVEQEATR